jgi:hypothetical protein
MLKAEKEKIEVSKCKLKGLESNGLHLIKSDVPCTNTVEAHIY